MKRTSARPILVLGVGIWLAAVCSLRAQQDAKKAPSPQIANNLASLTGNLVFTPLTPCRILDTRPASGVQGAGTGPIAAGTVISLQVANGSAVSCGVPFPASKAAVLNFIAVGAVGPGDLRAWPWDSSNPAPPNASVLNYARQVSLSGLNIANGLVVPICDDATETTLNCVDDLFLRPDVSATHVVIDVLGYFAAPPPLTVMTPSAPFSVNTTTRNFSVHAACPSGFSVTGGGIDHGDFAVPGVNILSSKPAANGWTCEGFFSADGGDWTGNCYAVCARP